MTARKTKPANRHVINLLPWQTAAIWAPFTHTAFFGGVSTGKTYTGAHFAIYNIETRPDCTGFIGANTYDQLSQATLRELLYWLDEYGYDWVIDKRPPAAWTAQRRFKKYSNVLSVLVPTENGPVVCYVITRVLGQGNPLRGIEFSWYWIDETRDTPKNTHDIILSRMREGGPIGYRRGLVTTTTNGEDWTHARFVLGSDGKRYGSLHVATEKSVKAGIVSSDFYEDMLASYDDMVARQELFAEHVNTAGMPAYRAYSEANERTSSPFSNDGAVFSPYLPVVVGLDFNVNPMCWTIGQYNARRAYWFDELNIPNTNTQECAPILVEKLLAIGIPKTKLHVILIGDATGKSRNTKATESDYMIIGMALDLAGITWENQTPASNPPVKQRVNNFNAHCKAADGTVRLWLHPDRCPNLRRDCLNTVFKADGVLDQVHDKSLTHATDGVGYVLEVLDPIRADGHVGGLRVIRR